VAIFFGGGYSSKLLISSLSEKFLISTQKKKPPELMCAERGLQSLKIVEYQLLFLDPQIFSDGNFGLDYLAFD
jgi:hypothetical protein